MSYAPWVPDAYCETHEWRSAVGEVIRFVTRTEATNRFMPPVSLNTIKVPQAMGAIFREAHHDERIVVLPVVVPGPTAGRQELRRWAKALDPVKGEGTLTVVQGDYAGRQLVCAYESGLDDFSEEYPGLGMTALAFHASDPYWQDAEESSIITGLDPTVYKWFPFPPLVLGASDVFAVKDAVNAGDVTAWPVVTVDGPGLDLMVENQTTGLSWSLPGPMNAGQRLIVDTRPGKKSVQLDGFNALPRLTKDSSLFPLVSGSNRISITFDAATSQTEVAFTWRNRWLSA